MVVLRYEEQKEEDAAVHEYGLLLSSMEGVVKTPRAARWGCITALATCRVLLLRAAVTEVAVTARWVANCWC